MTRSCYAGVCLACAVCTLVAGYLCGFFGLLNPNLQLTIISGVLVFVVGLQVVGGYFCRSPPRHDPVDDVEGCTVNNGSQSTRMVSVDRGIESSGMASDFSEVSLSTRNDTPVLAARVV